MDLAAFADMERLEDIVRKNDIEIPRERGYRLMSEQEPIPKEDYQEALDSVSVWVCEDLLTARPKYSIHANLHVYSSSTTKQAEKYVKDNEIQWDIIHGEFRKSLKFKIKQYKKRIQAQFDIFNKYAGRKDVIMVHARVGNYNWREFDCHKLVEPQPWFIEKVDDYFDRTYCDIYCRIKEEGNNDEGM